MFDATQKTEAVTMPSDGPITKELFLAAMRQGLQHLEWTTGAFYRDSLGRDLGVSGGDDAKSACSFGLAARALGVPAMDIVSAVNRLPTMPHICMANNSAKTAEEAIENISRLDW